jgi:transcriptional regulator with XRE-family HTH domain
MDPELNELPAFGLLLRQYREKKQWSQSRLAARCDFNHSYISRLEAGGRSPSAETVSTLIDQLELSVVDASRLRMSAGFMPGNNVVLSTEMVELVRLISVVRTLDPDAARCCDALVKSTLATVKYIIEKVSRDANLARPVWGTWQQSGPCSTSRMAHDRWLDQDRDTVEALATVGVHRSTDWCSRTNRDGNDDTGVRWFDPGHKASSEWGLVEDCRSASIGLSSDGGRPVEGPQGFDL